MQKRLDGIKKVKRTVRLESKTTALPRPLGFDGIMGASSKQQAISSKQTAAVRYKAEGLRVKRAGRGYQKSVIRNKQIVSNEKTVVSSKLYGLSRKSLALGMAAILLLGSFGFGFWSAFATEKSRAEFSFEGGAPLINRGPIALMPAPDDALLNLNSQDLYNMPLDRLEATFAQQQELLVQQQQEKQIWTRAEKIQKYLQNKDSPLAEAARTIAEQPHWRLILAITFAESSWGKNCVNNNCSNIGVKPGHELWHTYKTYDDWVADFNQLLERRYKDWTLDQMCGVYVKPCNQNWLLATTQALDELKQAGIE